MAVIAVEAIVEIIVASKLFEPLRTRVIASAVPLDAPLQPPALTRASSSWWPFAYFWLHWLLASLLSCGYCLSVWVAFLIALCLPGAYFGLMPQDNIIIKGFLLHRLSNVFHVVYELVRRGRVRTYDHSVKVERVRTPEVPQ